LDGDCDNDYYDFSDIEVDGEERDERDEDIEYGLGDNKNLYLILE